MKPNAVQIIVVLFIGICTVAGIFILGWCAIWKIYIDAPMMIALNGLTSGLAGSLTTLLVGRTVSQLNQNSDVKNQPQIQTEPALNT